ncbi:MAG TPA: c-type cytochrome [Geminicoccaceae bacterium]|nr:c-type cytochrome [Geminicoccaceae bacterium]
MQASPAAAADGDPARGERAFQRCYACHSVDPSETGLEGPNLHGVVGRPAGAVDGFAYSEALQARAADGLVWDEAALDAFLADPQGFLPDNAMGFFGLRDEDARADLIAYLKAAAAR